MWTHITADYFWLLVPSCFTTVMAALDLDRKNFTKWRYRHVMGVWYIVLYIIVVLGFFFSFKISQNFSQTNRQRNKLHGNWDKMDREKHRGAPKFPWIIIPLIAGVTNFLLSPDGQSTDIFRAPSWVFGRHGWLLVFCPDRLIQLFISLNVPVFEILIKDYLTWPLRLDLRRFSSTIFLWL